LNLRRVVAAALAGAAGVGAALGAAACGGGDKIPATFTTSVPGPITQLSASTPSTASTTASATTASGATPTGTGAAPTGTSTGTATGETGPGGGGDEQGTRVPAIFTLKAGKLTPSTISVPAFLAAEVTVTSTDTGAHTVVVQAGKGYTIPVPPQGSGTTKVPGQKAGKVTVLVDGKPGGTLSWGGEPGP
jgi:hypothetical protein